MSLSIGLGLGLGVGSGPSAPALLDLTSLNATGLFRDYTGSGGWAGTPSAGTSGSNSLMLLNAAVPAGTQNGHGYAIFNGVDRAFYHATAGTFLSNNAYTISILGRGRAPIAADGTNPWNNAAWIGCDLPRIGAPLFTSSGVAAFQYAGGAYPVTAYTALAAATWAQVDMVYNGTTLSCSLNRGAAKTVAAAATALAGAQLRMGFCYLGYSDCDVLEVLITQTALGASTLDDVRLARMARYAVTL